MIYEGQEARTASERFLIDVGDGEAVVSVMAKQNHDKSGWLINGDFQSTNGTSSVADPSDRGTPAKLRVAVDYCASGVISTERDGDDRTVTFDMGELFVCDTTLEHTADNDAAFQQDDTPTDFHGDFVSFVAGAVEAAAAPPCPADQLNSGPGTSPPTSPSSSSTSWASPPPTSTSWRPRWAPATRTPAPRWTSASPASWSAGTPRRDRPTRPCRSSTCRRGHRGRGLVLPRPGRHELDDINDVALPK